MLRTRACVPACLPSDVPQCALWYIFRRLSTRLWAGTRSTQGRAAGARRCA